MIAKKFLNLIFIVFLVANLVIFFFNKNPLFQNRLKILGSSNEKVDWHDYKFMLQEANRQGPGEKGKPHKLKSKLEIDENKFGFKEEGFSTVVSEKISPNRSLPDVRLEVCKSKKYLKNLPKVSIVVIFFNEHWSLLTRCLHSIYNRTPQKLLHEIILVNDGSTNKDLDYPLKIYLRENFGSKVRLFVNNKQRGLIATRVQGARVATGEVIVFLDSHIEVNVNWLPPLLEPIALNPKTATVPVLDSLSPHTLEYEDLGHGSRGGFDWYLVYKWLPPRPQDLKIPGEPFPLPVMTGGAYAIRRDYFFELGAYDEDLILWNGENFEMSFKLWLCGGRLLDVPCSHVAHTSKLRSKYREGDKIFDQEARNLKRVAEVWMDEYKEVLYKTNPQRFAVEAGDLTKRFELKKSLNCKPFKYFLDEIASDMVERFPPYDRGNFASGVIQSQADPKLCITMEYPKFREPLKLATCSINKTHPAVDQNFLFTWHRFITWKETVHWQCIDAVEANFEDCHFMFGNQLWKYDLKTHQLTNPPDNRCLAANLETKTMETDLCDEKDVRQKFTWGYLNVSAIENWEHFGVKLPD